MALFEMLIAHAGVYCAEQAYHGVSRSMRQSEFLRYEPRYLIDCYREEDGRIGTDLPYVEELRLLAGSWDEFLDHVKSLRVLKAAKPFELAKSPPPELSDLQAHALSQFETEGRVDRNEAVVRLEGCDAVLKTLRIQKCAYTDGLRSNYALDLKGHMKFGTSDLSLRAVLQSQYGRKLPPLSDKRLSNAIGIAAVIFYKTEEGEILPYLPRRSKPTILSETIGTTRKQAVFPGGFHCTASGETMWRGGQSTFAEIFTGDICRELDEEVGIGEPDLAWIYPVSLCREFLRGGKPQLFFTGFTKLPPRELNARRRTAIQRQIARGRQEIEDEVLVAETPEELYSELWRHGTVEAVVNMALAHDCAILAHRARQFR
jgi:hypothetical protein